MHREYHRWHSPSLGRDMELLVFGHAGARVLAFPRSFGPFYEWEDRGLIDGLREPIERGWLQVVCLDSVDLESWYARHLHPADRARRHDQYDRYVASEVVPFTTHRNPNPFLIATGASFGGYHAVNFALRHPHLVGRVVGMSGLYDIGMFADGYHDDTIYFHNPCAFVGGESCPQRLDALRNVQIILAVGRDDALSASNEALSHHLWSKGIWHALRIWDGWYHDWPYWRHMLGLYIGGHD